ncbi:cAMP-dependent protein kinase regulatory subunit [Phytophthora citrophthora]|uniref:cAMP-dependent protein kinase regulatory subunit n=1 Tax=Phytophthora citrophthora TaxID=4793 RepID=A0AAD9FXU3_9STRA|nr:cAMP-dependent protein kinase regulatory subunit [Phytophthora citrophthora]
MAALPTVATASSNSPTSSNATTRGPRLSRVGRRSGAAPNLSAWAENDRVEKASVSSASLSRANKWSALRREILPHPALMTISAKVQHIIDHLKTGLRVISFSALKRLYVYVVYLLFVSAKKLCKEMEFLHLNGGQVVVNQGEKGSTCFILMSGLVSVYVRNPDEQSKHQRFMRSSSISTSMRRLSAATKVNYGNKVVTLTPGATFGELCLIEPDSKRSATVIVDEQAQMANFIVLTAASYLRMTRSQTIEGTITDNIAFLQHLLIFKNWTKMQLMHIVNSMKLVNVSAGQYLTRKGADADSFFVILRGEAVESVNLTINESSEMSMGEVRGVQRSITVELTFLGKFDVAGEYLASEKKISQCPVDIRATTDVDCLVLTRKLFMLHFGGKDLKAHVIPTRRRLRSIAEAREAWRETRILQALQYPNLRVPITRKLMRLSGNCCLICGRRTHVAGDQLCMELPSYYMVDEKKKKRDQKERGRKASKHRISIAPQPTSSSSDGRKASRPAIVLSQTDLPSLREQSQEDLHEHLSPGRLGTQLVTRQWQEAEKNRPIRIPQRPMTTPTAKREPLAVTSITRSSHISRRQEEEEQRRLKDSVKPRSIQEELQHIRDNWPYCWSNDEDGQQDATTGIIARMRSRSPSPTPKSHLGRQSGSLTART